MSLTARIAVFVVGLPLAAVVAVCIGLPLGVATLALPLRKSEE